MPTAIVLDIDETLVFSSDDHALYRTLKPHKVLELRSRLYGVDIKSDGAYYHMWGIKRPYLDEFISFCFRELDYVIVWSAGTKEYVDQMIKVIFTSSGHKKPHFWFSRDTCYDLDGDLIKPLKHLHEIEKTLKNVPVENMIILDNKESNFALNVENGLLIDDYMPKTIEEMKEDDKNLLYAQVAIMNRLIKIR